ncbi:hypothetical protein KM043_017688 [Ampulex compressa]|nr:hypothetical protein KM043_017688 [Ampulex compressa]
MKNLMVHRTICRPLALSTILQNVKDQKISYALNPNNDDLYILIENNLYTIPSDSQSCVTSTTIVEDVDNKFCALEYSVITQELYAGCINGRIFGIDVDSKVEEVAKLQNGLYCMVLSPDHEMFTIITQTTVVTMLSTFDIISEVDLYSCDFGQDQFVTVGWGSKETQFHGSQGKSMATTIEPLILNVNDNGVPKITWREDSSIELLSGLGECLAWRPSGDVIATDQTLANRRVIALFEKNGLKHREFTLPVHDKEIQIKNLLWSMDSELLAIHLYKLSTSTNTVQLWTEHNYHCRGIDSNDKCIIGVVDGSKLLLTSFRKGVVPPPMAHVTIDVGEEINNIVFAPEVKKHNSWINSNTFFCVSSSSALTFYRQSMDSDSLDYYKVGSYKVEWMEDRKFRCCVYHFLWLKEDVVICSMLAGDREFLCILRLEEVTLSSKGHIVVRHMYPMDAPIEHIFPSPSPVEGVM